MAYSTVAQIRLLTNQIQGKTMTDADILTFIADADAYIDSELNEFYVTPFTTVPSTITTISNKLAASWIFIKLFSGQDRNVSQQGLEYKSQALDTLERVKYGRMRLLDSSGNVISPRPVVSTAPIRVMPAQTQPYPNFSESGTSPLG